MRKKRTRKEAHKDESVSGAICGFAQSADRAARFADPHIAQLICRSRSYRKIAQAYVDVSS